MKGKSIPAVVGGLIVIALLLLVGNSGAKDKKPKVTACSNPHPEQLCTAANTCGSSSSPCELVVKRVGGGVEASVTPNIANFPKNAVICINTGTSVTWKGDGKNTGVMVDFGEKSPFEPGGTISAGSDRPVTVMTKVAGCYKYSVGACTPGTIYGMCGNSDYAMVVTSK